MWTFLIFLQQDSYSHGFITALGNNILFIVLFGGLAYTYYGKVTKTKNIKARAIALNIAILPLAFINILFMPKVIVGDKIGESGMAYLLPMIYSPMIFIIVWIIAYIFISYKKV